MAVGDSDGRLLPQQATAVVIGDSDDGDGDYDWILSGDADSGYDDGDGRLCAELGDWQCMRRQGIASEWWWCGVLNLCWAVLGGVGALLVSNARSGCNRGPE